MDADSFIGHVKAEDIYKDVEIKCGTSSFKLDRPLLKGEMKKVINGK